MVQSISEQLSKVAEELGNEDHKESFIQSCHLLSEIPQIGPKAVSSDAKKFVDERKKVLDGFAKGMLKVAKMHSGQ